MLLGGGAAVLLQFSHLTSLHTFIWLIFFHNMLCILYGVQCVLYATIGTYSITHMLFSNVSNVSNVSNDTHTILCLRHLQMCPTKTSRRMTKFVRHSPNWAGWAEPICECVPLITKLCGRAAKVAYACVRALMFVVPPGSGDTDAVKARRKRKTLCSRRGNGFGVLQRMRSIVRANNVISACAGAHCRVCTRTFRK